MSEVIREMATLSTNVGELRPSVDGYITTSAGVMKRTELYMQIFVGAVIALVAAVIGLVIAVAAT